MKNDQMKNFRISKLGKGKVKGVGFFEKISLMIAGYIDGRKSLPRENTAGGWVSPHLDREVRSYDEFASRMWGRLQIEEETAYAHLGELMDSLVHTRSLLEEAKLELEEAVKAEKSVDTSRKYGESKLSEGQVIARRANERAKRLAPLKSRVNSLQSKLSSEIDEFSRLHNRILEDNNSTRMICNRVKDHLHQRMDVYWNAALRKHPDNARMPVIPCVEVKSRAEAVYLESHTLLMRRAESLSQILSDDEKEAV